jgi:hypothetical protein
MRAFSPCSALYRILAFCCCSIERAHYSLPPPIKKPADGPYGAPTRTSKTEFLARGGKRHKWGAMLSLAILIAVGVGLLYFILRPPLPPKVMSYVPVTRDGLPKSGGQRFGSLVSNGSRIYFNERKGGHWGIAQVSSTAGEPVAIPVPFHTGVVRDVSPG